MNEKIRRITNADIPDVLFKYRDWSNKYHKRLITKREIYFTRPSDFNDPFDGNIPIRWDMMTYDECFQKNLDLVKIIHEDKSQKQVRAIAKKFTDEKSLWHPDRLQKEQPEQLEKWDSIIGLFSLSEVRDNILMWSHYASNHTGFVVGLNTLSLAESYGFDYIEPIQYQKEYPIIGGVEDNTPQFHKKFFYKSEEWRYEKEWRISKNHIEKRTVQIYPDAFSQIIIGCRMDKNTQEEVVNTSKKYLGDSIPIYKARKHEEDFKLEIQEIN